jgi:predicted acylesterase/phospholipase RssA
VNPLDGFDTRAVAERRRPFDQLERRLVRNALALPDDPETARRVQQLRYAISFARLTTVVNPDGREIDLTGVTAPHAQRIRDLLSPHLVEAEDVREALRRTDLAVAWTRAARAEILGHGSLSRDALEAEVSERLLVVASGGGGGAGYVYPGAYEALDRAGLAPSLLVGTSIGALMSMFRARSRRFDLATLLSAARALSWTRVFRAFEGRSRYGLPATLRLRLHDALGPLFREAEDRTTQLSDLHIPFYAIVTGIRADGLKHDLHYYETLLGEEMATPGRGTQVRAGIRAMGLVREFLATPEALQPIVVGREPGTQGFDVLDAAGFSAAIPGVIHYDVDPGNTHMSHILDHLYAVHGVARFGEGGMVSNVPARVAWETAVSGHLGPRRNVFVLALDCFAPHPSRLAWYPFQQLVRQSNVFADRAFADVYLPFRQTLSPLNLVPPVEDALQAIRWGRDEIRPLMPFIERMMARIPTLPDAHG